MTLEGLAEEKDRMQVNMSEDIIIVYAKRAWNTALSEKKERHIGNNFRGDNWSVAEGKTEGSI